MRREAVSAAPSLLPPSGRGAPVSVSAAGTAIENISSALASLGALLRDRLSRAVTLAATASDRAACADAARGAARICQPMAGGDDDARPR